TCVMALLYLSLIHRKIRQAGLTMGLDRALETLRGIRRAVYHYPGSAQPIRKLCLLESTERELLTALKLDPEAI
ncbi:MAG: hypothetical protein SCM96_05300, partial [Acidobacteriota bacterium]|nr:hypothetical protein [Acidobacteriota bacterium]